MAGTVGDPDVDREAFEGWEEILRREEMGDGIAEIEEADEAVEEVGEGVEQIALDEEDEEDEEEVYGTSPSPFLDFRN